MCMISFLNRRFRKFQTFSPEEESKLRQMVEEEYKKLGRFSWHERVTVSIFSAMITVWLLKRPPFIHGWDHYIKLIFNNEK